MIRRTGCFHCLSSLMIFLSVLCSYTPAEGESFTGESPLQPGPYSPGFTTYELFDAERVVLDKYDYFGTPVEGVRKRPIQICVWYPAENSLEAPKMVIGEYNFPYPRDLEFVDYLSEIQNREIGRLQAILRGDQGLVLDLLNYEVRACHDIPHAGGKFRLILSGPDLRKGILENSGLFEYLASNGFVVATIHSVGSYELNTGESSADLETLVRDMEFALAFMKDQPYVDPAGIGLLGYGTGAAAALLLQMRDYDIDAVACIQGNFDDDNIRRIMESNPYFNIVRMDVPSLYIYQGSDSSNDSSLIEKIKYSDRYTAEFTSDYDVLFTNYELIASLRRDSTGQLSPQNIDGYKISCLYALNFLKSYIYDDSAAGIFMNAKPEENGIGADILTASLYPGQEIPPAENQFINIIRDKGVETAIRLYRKFKPSNPDHVFFREININVLGYQYLQSGRAGEAVMLFELNTEAFPTSANAWDSYGEACIATGDYPRALANYRKALEILPQDTNITDQLRNIIRDNAPAQISRLEELVGESSE